jgi:hypothetical protein
VEAWRPKQVGVVPDRDVQRCISADARPPPSSTSGRGFSRFTKSLASELARHQFLDWQIYFGPPAAVTRRGRRTFFLTMAASNEAGILPAEHWAVDDAAVSPLSSLCVRVANKAQGVRRNGWRVLDCVVDFEYF